MEMTLTYHHGDPARIEVALTVGGDPVILPGGCTIDLPEPLQTRFRFLMEVAHSEGTYVLQGAEEWVGETTLLQFETDLTYTGQGYTIDFGGLQRGGVLFSELYDQFVEDPLAPPAGPALPATGYYWGSPPLLSDHGVDFGRTMVTPSLGRSRFVEISGHKPVNGLLVESSRQEGGAIVSGYHTILSERDLPGLMTQIYPLFMFKEDVTFEPVRFLPNLFESVDVDNDGIRELIWNPGAGACPTGGPDMVVDVQDSGFLSDDSAGQDATGLMAVTYCNVGGQDVGAGMVEIEVDSPVMYFLDSEDCAVVCEPEVCGGCGAGDCPGLCSDPGRTRVECWLNGATPAATCGRVSLRWMLRAPPGCLPNSCGSLAGAQEIWVWARYMVPGDVRPGDNEYAYKVRTRFEEPYEVCAGVDVCTDEHNCGRCGESCLDGGNVLDAICHQGRCQITACEQVAGIQYYDCNLDAADGCEGVDDSLELVEPVPGYPAPELRWVSSQTLNLSDSFDYFPLDPVADELELHRRWTFLTYPHTSDGPLIEKAPEVVHLSMSVEGEDQYSVVNMYSQRRIPVPSPFYLFVRGNVGSKYEPYSALDMTLEGVNTSLTYSGPLYEVTPAPLLDSHTGLKYSQIPYLWDPLHDLNQGAVWQIMPTPAPSGDVQVPLVAVMSDNLLQIHSDRDVNALLVTLAGEAGQAVRSTFYSQAARPDEILFGAGYQFPAVVSIDRFLPSVFDSPGILGEDFTWVPPKSSGGCAGQQGVVSPMLDLQMSGVRPGRAENVIVTTCNAGGLAENVSLGIELDGVVNSVTVPPHCTCVTSVDPGFVPVACSESSCRNHSIVQCSLPDLGAGVCVQTRLDVAVERPDLEGDHCHELSCDPALLAQVQLGAELSWDHPQLGRDFATVLMERDADCAWDPNVKLAVPESPGTVGPDGRLHYFVFYENDPEATAPAVDVRIIDELDPLLDETTLSLISRGGVFDPVTRTITWDFDGINLAPGAGGHVEFFVKPVAGLAPGTVIENQAAIVFDYNPPMVTAPTVHVIAVPADTTPPRMHPCVDRPLLWPPNHKLVPVVIDTFAWDDSGGPISFTVTVQSDEPESGSGHGGRTPDWLAPVVDAETGTVELTLRSERYDPHQGRTYTIRIDASDPAGNVGTAEVEVVVPGNMSHLTQLWSALQNDSRYSHCSLPDTLF